jgi:type IV pilus assembly protein PilC
MAGSAVETVHTMPTYTYKARDMRGKAVSGTIALTSEKSVREYLRLNELFVTDLVVADEKEQVKAPFFRRRVKLSDLVVFSRQFASMVKSGVPIVQTLESLAEQTESPVLRSALEDVRKDVETGTSLGAAIGQRAQVFPEMFISLVRAGEASGSLDNSLEIAAVQFDKEQELLEKIKSAFTYPIIVLCATALVLTIMLTCIVPVFAKIYKDLHAQLPLMTQMLVKISYALTHDTPFVIAGIIALGALVRYIYQTDGGRLFCDRIKLRLPVLGPLNRKVAIGRFVRALSAMVASGLPLTRGLEIAAGVAGNRVIADAACGLVTELRKGHPLSEPLERTGQFPKMVTRMVAVGEESGSLEAMLAEVAHFYDRDVEYNVKRLTTLLEPLLTAFLSLVVGFVVVSLYLPIFSLGQAIMHS